MTDLGTRIKGYEAASELVLPRRLPVLLRLDGNSFSKFTKHQRFEKPFDARFEGAMEAAAKAVMDYCSGSCVAYVQSDEITVLLRNDQTEQTDPFLANRTQKLTSLTAAYASVAFNKELGAQGIDADAVFDCRAFVVPHHEVQNVFLWRQQDAFKNCISAYAYYGLKTLYGRKTAQKMLHGKNTAERQELIFRELGKNPNDIPTHRKRGRCIYSETREIPMREVIDDPDRLLYLYENGHIDDPDQMVMRSFWEVDKEIPRFDKDKNYLDAFILKGED